MPKKKVKTKRRFKDQPGYVLFKSRWHSRKRLKREVDILERKLLEARAPKIEVELTNPTMYARAAWQDKRKTNAAEIKIQLKGKYTKKEAMTEARDRLEGYTGRLPDAPVGASPGLFFIDVGTKPLKNTTIQGRTVQINYHYHPQPLDIMLGRGVKNLDNW